MGFEAIEGFHQQPRSEFRQGGLEGRRRVGRADGKTVFEIDRAGVERGFHAHGRHPGFAVAGHERTMDRRRTAPARKQRGVDIDAAVVRDFEHLFRNDLPEGDHREHVGPQRPELVGERGAADTLRLQHVDAMRQRAPFHGGSLIAQTTTRRAIGLRDDGEHAVRGRGQQRFKRRDRERGCPEVDDAHAIRPARVPRRSPFARACGATWGRLCR